jgi:hypothetical protein
MTVRCARTGCPRRKATPSGQGEVLGRRLSGTRVHCGRATCDVARWVLRRRRIAATQFLRGACYGAGTAAVGVLAVWLRTR